MSQIEKSLFSLFSSPVEGEYTHVSMGEYKKGKFYLSFKKRNSFFELYNLVACNVPSIPLCIAEKPGKAVPLIGDFDISIDDYDSNKYPETELFSIEDVEASIKCFYKIIKKHFIDLDESDLICILLKKPLRVEKKENGKFKVKNGFHIHFPHLFVSQENVKNILIPAIKQELATKNNKYGIKIFQDITDRPELLLDEISSKCWLMYGSAKNEKLLPYKIFKIYNSKFKKISPYECFSKIEGITEKNVLSSIPNLLSLFCINKKIYEITDPIDSKINKFCVKKIYEKDNDLEDEQPSESIEFVEKIMALISPERAISYESWWGIGVALFNAGKGSQEFLNLWKSFSSHSENYDENSCDLNWENMQKKSNSRIKKTLSSLFYYAKIDNLLKFNELMFEKYALTDKDSILNIYTPNTDYRIAEMVTSMNSDSYIYGKNNWYQFGKVVWEKLEDIGRRLRPEMARIASVYNKERSNLIKKKKEDNDEDSGNEFDDEEQEEKPKHNSKLINEKILQITNLIKKLENYSGQTNIINSSMSMFGVDDLNSKMDSNPFLIAFKNGVYDLKTCMFRPGCPSDFLSKQLKTVYNENLKEDDEKVKKMFDFFEKIFPDEEVRKYYFEQICEVFLGGNRDKLVMIWTGSGNNGKSVTQNIFERMLGPLAVKIPTTLITGKKVQAGHASPEIFRTQGGVRWVVMDEFSPDEILDAGMIKLLSGNDTLYARDLHQKGADIQEFQPLFKLILICNTIPKIKLADDATWERIRVINFESKFLDGIDGKMSKEEQIKSKIFQKDASFSEKLNDIIEAFAWYLIKIFKEKEKIRNENGGYYNIFTPLKVQEATLAYRSNCDVIASFAQDILEPETNKDKDDGILVEDLFPVFKEWFSDYYQGKSCGFSKKEFVGMFIGNVGGDLKTGRTMGYRRKVDPNAMLFEA